MSVLDTPRIYVRGKISWDPGVANNNARLYDPEKVELVLPSGVAVGDLKRYIIDNCDALGIWNYSGTHDATFENVTVCGGAMPDGSGAQGDPVLGAGLQFKGKLVDLDAARVDCTQLFVDDLSLGTPAIGIQGTFRRRMHARHINFFRNLEPLPIAGIAGVGWLTVIHKADIRLLGQAQSPLLQAFATALADQAAMGLVLRFDSYATQYFQNGLENQIPQQPRTLQELKQLYQASENFSNPAYSTLVGSIGIWRDREPQSVIGKRCLVAASTPFSATRRRRRPDGTVETFQMQAAAGPAFASVDRTAGMLSFDFGGTIPEARATLEKADAGELTVVVTNNGQATEVGRIAATRYARAAYEGTGGILDVPLAGHPDPSIQKVSDGALSVRAVVQGQPVELLAESKWLVSADARDIYMDQRAHADIGIVVYRRGAPAGAGTSVVVGAYSRGGNFAARVGVITTDATGTTMLPLDAQTPGFMRTGSRHLVRADQSLHFRQNSTRPMILISA